MKDLYKRLEDITIDWPCNRAGSLINGKPLGRVILYDKHLIGKQFTKAIEGENTSLRNSCKRLNRRNTSFSKRLFNHWQAIKLTMHYRNHKASYF